MALYVAFSKRTDPLTLGQVQCQEVNYLPRALTCVCRWQGERRSGQRAGEGPRDPMSGHVQAEANPHEAKSSQQEIAGLFCLETREWQSPLYRAPRELPHASVAFAVGTPHASLQHGTAEARLSPDTRRPDPAFGVFGLCTVAFGDVTEQLAIVFGVRRFSGCQGSWGPQENEGTETFSFYSNSLEKHHVVTCNKIEKNMVFLGISISHLCVLFHTSTCILYRNY